MQTFIPAAVFFLCLILGQWDQQATASAYDGDFQTVSHNEYGGRRFARSSQNKHQYYFFHGWKGNMFEQWIEESAEAISQVNDTAVYRYDWSKIAALSYDTAARAVKNKLGKRVGGHIIIQYQKGNVDLNKLTLVGHGLGAHIAGIAGKTVFRKLGKKVATVIGASPTGRNFHDVSNSRKLHKDDASCVAVLHTDQDNLGYEDPIGALDFFANGGRYQPGCYGQEDECSHKRAALYLAEAFDNSKLKVEQPNKSVVENDDTQTFIRLVQGDCSMGNGNYNFDTNSAPPFLRR